MQEDLNLLAEVRAVNRRAPLAVLANKADAAERGDKPIAAPAELQSAADRVIVTSAVRGDGLEDVKRALAEMLHLSAGRGAEAMGLHERQRQCLLAAADAAGRARELLAGAHEVADVAELAAVELRAALAELGRISGQIVTEDVLGRIFARFCVGK